MHLYKVPVLKYVILGCNFAIFIIRIQWWCVEWIVPPSPPNYCSNSSDIENSHTLTERLIYTYGSENLLLFIYNLADAIFSYVTPPSSHLADQSILIAHSFFSLSSELITPILITWRIALVFFVPPSISHQFSSSELLCMFLYLLPFIMHHSKWTIFAINFFLSFLQLFFIAPFHLFFFLNFFHYSCILFFFVCSFQVFTLFIYFFSSSLKIVFFSFKYRLFVKLFVFHS